MSTFRLMDGVAGRPGVGSTGTQPPAAATGFTGTYIAGLAFRVALPLWLTRYWWWVPPSNGVTAAQKFALWQGLTSSSGVNEPAGTVTGPVMTAGQWNAAALASPLQLSPYVPYVAATGFASTSPAGFPLTQNQFGGSPNPYSAGISNGPLFAFPSSSLLANSLPQSPFSTAGLDPSANFPHTNDQNDLLWLDLEVTDVQPGSQTTFRGFPHSPGGPAYGSSQSLSYTLGMEFSLTQACALSKIWHFSPPGSTVLPTRCAIWVVSSQTELAGSDNQSPAWKDVSGSAASAGDGWIYCDYSLAGVVLQASTNYKVSTFANAGSATWFSASANFWGNSGLWSAGIANGPLVIPGQAAATSPGQDSWLQSNTWGYPSTSSNPEYDGIDVEVELLSASAPSLLMAAGVP